MVSNMNPPISINRVKLKEVAVINMGQSPAGDTYNNVGAGTPLLNGPTEFGLSHPTTSVYTTAPTKTCRKGDLLFCVRGSTTGRMNWADREYCIGRGICAIRAMSGIDDTFFVYYTIVSELDRLLSLCAGSVFPNISVDDLESFEISWPDKDDRTNVVAILRTLDDRILLNSQININLEEIGKMLFKRWFVDFEFPNEEGKPHKSSGGVLVDSELGRIPRGWHIKELGELTDIVVETVMPQESLEASFLHYSIPAYDESERPVLNSGQEIKSMKFLIDNESVLVSKLNPEKMRIWLPFVKENNKAICSTEFIVYKAKKGLSRVFIYFVVKTNKFSDFFSSLVTGSTGSRQRVPPKDTLSFKIAFPKEELLVWQFCKTIDPLIKMRGLNLDQIGVLSQIRDLLLPKLMSGKIRVPVLQKAVET